jgi:hypothetical protein
MIHNFHQGGLGGHRFAVVAHIFLQALGHQGGALAMAIEHNLLGAPAHPDGDHSDPDERRENYPDGKASLERSRINDASLDQALEWATEEGSGLEPKIRHGACAWEKGQKSAADS